MGKRQKATGGDAVIYARYSSHNQRDVSIEQQVEACRKHAAELGLTVTATYEDRAISGKTDKRPSFQRMMRDAEQHKFAYVLAWKSNRIGRNMMQALVNESRLVDCGVKVFYAEEDFDDNAAGRFALRSMMNVNQFYIENMAEDVKRGLYDNAKKGLVNGSLPLGYKRGADGKPEIDEPKAAIVREIYTRVAAGELFASIAADLNARGIRTARGREWNKGSFHVLCHNDRYRGIYMYGDIRIPGGMPRIISDELFYDAQEAYGMKKDNRYGRARHGAENYLLTGKLYCGHCGSYMVGISGTSKTGEMHYYYACQKHRLEHTCEKKAIRRDVIENAVARVIMMYCLDDETIDFIVDSTIAYFKQKDHELHIEAMENELAAVQQAISNLMKAIEAGIITPTTRTRLLDLEEQQAKLSAKINTAKAERVEIDRDDLIAGLQLFRTGDIKNKKFLAKLFNTFLIAVYLYDDNRLKIVFSFTGNHNSVEIPLELDNDCPDSEIVSDETEVRMSHLECGKEGLKPVEKTVIDRCVHKIYAPYFEHPCPETVPMLEDLYNALLTQDEPEAHHVAAALEIYVKGSLNIFNHRTNVDIDNRIVCYDIKQLGKQLKKLGMLIVQDQVWGRVTANRSVGKSTRYYADEFHLLLKDEQTAAYSVEIWKRFRKWGGIPTALTQNVKDLLASPEVSNIFENSDFVYMLNQANGDRQILAKQLNISPHQLSYVTHSGEGEGLLFFGNVILPFVDHFPKDLELYRILTTRLSEVVEAKHE